MKTEIRQRARELGFDDCRFTTAAPPATAEHLRRWLDAGKHGELHYLERNSQKRMDPAQVLPRAKSIISLAVSYHRDETSELPHPARNQEKPNGVIARYARFEDYHDLMGERLKTLTDFIGSLAAKDHKSLWYVDTGPFLERDFAQRAGLGFVGKHTNLISRRFGNWIFLSEIITTLALDPDSPETNHCGSCVRCINACPTQAITAPFQLDARKCISYLTIELKGSIPVPLRRAIGNRIYGCDDCLAVCPWNRFAREGSLMRKVARSDLDHADLIQLLSLDDVSFKKMFLNSPIMRAKRRGFLRNVCVALGNVGDRSTLPALEKASQEAEPLIAEHATWAIQEIEARSAEIVN